MIRTQLESLLEIMLVTVQDRVCTESNVLECIPLVLNKDIKEVPVWGIDSYTRRMVEMILEDKISECYRSDILIKRFIEKRLLPAINAQSPELAHNMNYAVNSIINTESSLSLLLHCTTDTTSSSSYHKLDITYALALKDAIQEYTIDVFRIHPKGTGVVCMNPEGIKPHVFVTEYLGELYPSYRWCERMDVVDQAQKTFDLKPTLPDFYNILLERPRQDPNGYGLLYVGMYVF